MMYLINDSNGFRKNIRHVISKLLKVDVNDSIVENFEKSIFNHTIEVATLKNVIKKWDNGSFGQLYIDRFRSIYFNLKNDTFVHNIREGIIKSQEVAYLSHQEYDPEHWTTMMDIKNKRNANKFTKTVQASTDAYVCRKCKSRECTYTEIQTRSSDESMTIFVSCLSCGKNWTC